MRTFDIVVAADEKRGIGKDGGLPWKLPKDMAYFKRVTTAVKEPGKRNAVLMGRKTWDSIPAKFRPLPERLNIVISRQTEIQLPESVLLADSFETALSRADQATIENVFVIGGGEIFRTALQSPGCKLLYLTDIHADFQCDTFLPDYNHDFVPFPGADNVIERDNGIQYEFKVLIRTSMLSGREPAGVCTEGQSGAGR